nr:hypothetical protein [uncultured Cohaesibacter sp.]
MDADVISMESARPKMELLEAFSKLKYPKEIAPRIYDTHSFVCLQRKKCRSCCVLFWKSLKTTNSRAIRTAD